LHHVSGRPSAVRRRRSALPGGRSSVLGLSFDRMTTNAPVRKSGPAFMLRALAHKNYKLFFGGQTISLIGTWMTRIATSWLVYRLSGSALLLGVVGFAGQIPSFLLGPVAGVLVDRWNRHRLLVATQILALLQSLAMAVLALSGYVKIWHIIALSVFQGLINAFDMPARPVVFS